MTKFINFGSIEGFDKIAKKIDQFSKYMGDDENGKPIYNKASNNPTLKAIGTEKIHGTNFSVGFNTKDGLWFQKKTEVITPTQDNAGSAFWGSGRKGELIHLINSLAIEYDINLETHSILLCGEWAGDGVQKKAAVTGLKKSFFIFQHFKVSPINQDDKQTGTFWLETLVDGKYIEDKESGIYNLMNFQTYEIDIDFNNPLLSYNKMNEMVAEIELKSPVGKTFGFDENIAEGIVFTINFNNKILKWKVKGDKHSNTRVRKLKSVDNEKEQLLIDIAEQVTPAWRLEQMANEVNDTLNGGVISIDNIATFLRAVINDVIKEDVDLLIENDLEIKNISSKISKIARMWYLDQIQTQNLNNL